MKANDTRRPQPYWFYVKLFAVMVIAFYYLLAKTTRWIIHQQFAANK